MKDHAAGIDDPAQPGSHQQAKAGRNLLRTVAGVCGIALTLSGDLRTNRVDDAGVTKLSDQPGIRRLIDERAYTRQGLSWLNPGTP
jgi:hypothetical protein